MLKDCLKGRLTTTSLLRACLITVPVGLNKAKLAKSPCQCYLRHFGMSVC